jgi:hypothetical protein
MGGARKRGRWAGWLGVVAVLGNVLAGALCHLPAQAAAASGPVDPILGPLAICTAHGEQAPPPGGNQDGERPAHCTVCTLLAGSALVVALAFAAVAFPQGKIFPPRSAARTLADHLSLGGIRSRAPPLSA